MSESALTSRLRAVRRAVGDDGAAQRVIRTAHGRGYQFVADTREVAADEVWPRWSSSGERLAQQIRFCSSANGPGSPTPPSAKDHRS